MAVYGSKLKERALRKVGTRNQVGMCQLESRTLANLPSAGDYDHDDDADAVDAWKRAKKYGKVIEAKDIRGYSDVPAGTLAYYGGGSSGHGHVMPTIGGSRAVSTDGAGPGVWGNVHLNFPVEQWGMTFLGFVVEYFDESKLVAQAALDPYLRDKPTVKKLPTPGRFEFTKGSIRTYVTLNQTRPMEKRTKGPVVRKIRQIRVNKHGQVRGRVTPGVGRWYDIDSDHARRIGNL